MDNHPARHRAKYCKLKATSPHCASDCAGDTRSLEATTPHTLQARRSCTPRLPKQRQVPLDRGGDFQVLHVPVRAYTFFCSDVRCARRATSTLLLASSTPSREGVTSTSTRRCKPSTIRDYHAHREAPGSSFFYNDALSFSATRQQQQGRQLALFNYLQQPASSLMGCAWRQPPATLQQQRSSRRGGEFTELHLRLRYTLFYARCATPC